MTAFGGDFWSKHETEEGLWIEDTDTGKAE